MQTRRRNTLLASAAALTMLAALSSAPARADALSPILGSYSGHFNNYEDFYDPATGAIVTSGFGSTGQQNFGLDVLGSISSSSGGVYGGPGTGDYLIGVFGGITVGPVYNNTTGAISPVFAPGTTAFANGGAFHIYEIPQADFGGTAAFNTFMNSTSTTGFTSGLCSAQTLAQVAAGTGFCYDGLTTLAGVKDVLDFNLVTSYNSLTLTGGTTIPVTCPATPTPACTLAASFNGALSGTATTWGDVTGGTDAAQFENLAESTPIGTLADISLIDDFCPEAEVSSTGKYDCASLYSGKPDLNWTVASSDPFNGTAIPEPASLALFGTGFLGLYAALRRRRRA